MSNVMGTRAKGDERQVLLREIQKMGAPTTHYELVPTEALRSAVMGANKRANENMASLEKASKMLDRVQGNATRGKPEQKPEPEQGADLKARLDKLENMLENVSLGTKTGPQNVTDLEVPTVFSKGMHKDSSPLDPGRYVRGMLTGSWKRAGREKEVFDAVTTSTGSGLVPEIISAQIIMDLLNASTIGESGTEVVRLASGAVSVPIESTAPSAEWASEGAELTDATAEFGTAAISPHKLAVYLTISNELAMDSPEIADRHIRRSLQNAMARGLDQAFLNGSGSGNEPLGLFTGSPGYEQDKSSTSLSWDMITDAAWTILGKGGMRENLRVIGNPAAFSYLDQLREDTSSGGYLTSTAPVNPPAVASDQVTVTSATPDNTSVLVGDFQNAVSVYEFGGMTVATDPSAAFKSDSIAFRLTSRIDFLVKYSDLLIRLDSVDLG